MAIAIYKLHAVIWPNVEVIIIYEDIKANHYDWYLDVFRGPGCNAMLFLKEKRELLLDRKYVLGVVDPISLSDKDDTSCM